VLALKRALPALAFVLLGATAASDKVSCDPSKIDDHGTFRCDFDVAMVMHKGTHVWIANFPLPGEGAFDRVNYALLRDGRSVFDTSSYGITFVRERERKRVRLKLEAWDKQHEDAKYQHRLKGRLFLQPDPKP